MMYMDSNEISCLSDELKPRRTPEPPSFSDLLPRPAVPDLSLIESSQSTNGPSNHSDDRNLSARHLSYNEWKKRAGFHSGRDNTLRHVSPHTNQDQSPVPLGSGGLSTFMSCNDKKRVVLDCISNPSQKYGLSDSAPCFGNSVSYTDFKKRPTSAPMTRSQSTKTCQSSQYSPQVAVTTGSSVLRHHATPDGYEPGRPTNRSAGMNDSSMLHRGLISECASRAVSTGEPVSLRGARCQENEFRDVSVPSKAVPSQICMQNSNHHARIPHHSYPAFALSPVDNFHSKLRPCCHNDALLPFARPSCSDPDCSSHNLHSTCKSVGDDLINTNYPSYNDLCRIVLNQNNEIKSLQAQVERLLLCQVEKTCPQLDSADMAKAPRLLLYQEQKKGAQLDSAGISKAARSKDLLSKSNKSHIAMVCEEGTQTSDSETKTDDNQKMSIGVMTSFIHAVAYSGRIGLRDIQDENSRSSHDKIRKSCTSSDSSDEESSASIDHDDKVLGELEEHENSQSCKECIPRGRSVKEFKQSNKRSKKSSSCRNHQGERKASVKCVKKSNSICSQKTGSCNHPGVSAAISAVRGCQAVLASNTGVRLDESLTFNAKDLPPVPEQPVSPVSSIHVDLQDYRESTTDETDSCESDCSSSNEQTAHPNHERKPHGWAFYNKMLGQVNKILTDKVEADPECTKNTQNLGKTRGQALDISSKRVAFQPQEGSEKAKKLKDLALRYLRENYPEELVSNSSPVVGNQCNGENMQEMTVYNVPASNMSFATFHYLERYNLLPENFNPDQYLAAVNMCGFNRRGMGNTLPQDSVHNGMNRLLAEPRSRNPRISSSKSRSKPHQLHPLEVPRRSPRKGYHKIFSKNHDHVAPPKTKQQLHSNPPPSRILDITALRQQPKLL